MLEILIAARLVLGLVLLVAGSSKLLALDRFNRVVRSYALLPELAIAPITLALPVAELLLAVALLGGWSSRLAATCAVVLLVLFATAIAANVLRRNTIDCGCGGWQGPTTVGWPLVARNVILISAAVAVAAQPPQSIPALLAQGRMAAEDIVALALCAMLSLVVVSATQRAIALLRTARSVAEVIPAAQSS